MPTSTQLLGPKDSPLVMELVAAAGVDVSGWAVSKKGPVGTRLRTRPAATSGRSSSPTERSR
jgi:hypothetical protein